MNVIKAIYQFLVGDQAILVGVIMSAEEEQDNACSPQGTAGRDLRQPGAGHVRFRDRWRAWKRLPSSLTLVWSHDH